MSIQLYQTAPELTESALPHELTHVRLAASPHFHEGLPLWLQEGVATSAESEQSRASKARKFLKAVAAGEAIPVTEVFAAKTYPAGDASDVFYAESLGIVESLVAEYGTRRFWDFADALAGGDQEAALASVYGLTPDGLARLLARWGAARK